MKIMKGYGNFQFSMIVRNLAMIVRNLAMIVMISIMIVRMASMIHFKCHAMLKLRKKISSFWLKISTLAINYHGL